MNLWTDFVYSLRLLRKNPGFSFLSISLIVMGMGISLVLYSLADNLALKSLPYDKGDRFVIALFSQPVSGVGFDLNSNFDPYRLQHFKENAESYETLSGMRIFQRITISDGASTEAFLASEIESGLLPATGIQPLLGRPLSVEDQNINSPSVVLISYTLWQNYYTGREDILGKGTRINGQNYTIIGVMPEGFDFPNSSDAWFPLKLPSVPQPKTGPDDLMAVGVLKEDVDIQSARTEFELINRQFQNSEADTYEATFGTNVDRYIQAMAWGEEYILIATISATFLIILLVIFNTGNLLTARAFERVQELAVRSAVGASQGRLVQSVMLESFIICSTGMLIGLFIAALSFDYIENSFRLTFGRLPSYFSISLDGNIILASVLFSATVWLFSSIGPALRVSGQDLNSILSDSSKGIAEAGSFRFSRLLVKLQVIVCSFLLIISGCLVLFLSQSDDVDLGIAEEQYLVGEVLLNTQAYTDPVQRQRYLQNLRYELQAQQEISEVTMVSHLPGTARDPGSQVIPYINYSIEDRDLRNREGVYPSQYLVSVDDNYFDFFGVEVIEGRIFDASITADSIPVVVIDQLLKERLWPEQSAIGKRIRMYPEDEGPWLEVIGVVTTVRHDSPVVGPNSTSSLFRPIAQSTPTLVRATAKSEYPDADFISVFKQAAGRVDRDIPITNIATLEKIIDDSGAVAYMLSDVFVGVSIISLLIAASGIYGIMSRSVLRRTMEIGVRKTVGADNLSTLGLFIKDGAVTLLTGLIVGGLPAVLAIYGLANFIPVVLDYLFLIAPLVAISLTLIVIAASYFPAKKIIMMEPGDALRYE